MGLIERIFENNRRWVESQKQQDPTFFEALAQGQHPEILFIGCADSRVPVASVTGLGPGEVFVHRNVANLVHPIDHNINSALQYAVEHLEVKHVIVCGHYGCGGVHAAMTHQDMGGLNKWLRGVRDVYRLHQAELDALPDDEARYRKLVELNVYEQCLNVMKTTWVQEAYDSRDDFSVHGWVYDLHEGLLHDLEVPFDAMKREIEPLYHFDHD